MKREIFNKYVKSIINRFGITEEELFSKTKKRELVDARQMLYYLCTERSMTIGYIQSYLKDKGYKVSHSTIIHGTNRAKELVDGDTDLATMITNIETQCTL